MPRGLRGCENKGKEEKDGSKAEWTRDSGAPPVELAARD
jgi:hypothetical protein